jgi:hypothetical protein
MLPSQPLTSSPPPPLPTAGYMKLWKQTHRHLSEQLELSPPLSSAEYRTVCMGGDWFTFPSHFFLPTGTKLAYVEDNFHGLLPQHFLAPHGSSIPSVLPVNDQNREERSRYTPLESCDYLVMTTPSCLLLTQEQECLSTLSPLQTQLLMEGMGTGITTAPASQRPRQFIPQLCEEIIDPVRSSSSLGRAYTIPFLSSKTNHFMQYCLYSRVTSSPRLENQN